MLDYIDFGTKLKVYFNKHYVGSIQQDSSGFFVYITAYDTIVMTQNFMEEIVNKLSELNQQSIEELLEDA